MGDELNRLMQAQRGEAAKAVLYTVGLDGVRTTCNRWVGPFDDQQEVIEQVEERALRQANLLGGVHTFLLELLDVRDEVLGTEFFRVGAEGPRDGSGRSLLSEPANEGGLVAQMMRHTEGVMRSHIQSTEKLQASAQKLIDTVSRRAGTIEDKYLAALEVVSSVVMGEKAHEIELVKAQGSAAAKKKIGDTVAGLIPELVASFVSGKTGSAAAGAAVSAKGLFSSITPDQFQGILTLLDDGQRMQLIGLVKRLAEEAEGQKPAALPKDAKGNGDARPTH